jgi:hypothetical protein
VTNFINLSTQPVEVSCKRKHTVTLSEKLGIILHYQVEWEDEIVRFEVENATDAFNSWFALGFSRRGEFERSDFCFIQKDQKHIVVSVDVLIF